MHQLPDLFVNTFSNGQENVFTGVQFNDWSLLLIAVLIKYWSIKYRAGCIQDDPLSHGWRKIEGRMDLLFF